MKSIRSTRTAVITGFVAGLLATGLMWGYTVIDKSASLPTQFPTRLSFLIAAFLFNVVGPILTVGVPVALFLRYGLVSPLVIFILEFTVWLSAGIISSGDAPWYYFALAGSVIYVPAYALVGSIEWFLRSRGILPSLPTA